MSRLKFTRQHVDIIKISNATKYLTSSKSLVPTTFSYFFDMEIFTPRTWITVDEMADIFGKNRDKTLMKIREIQLAYKRPALDGITVKDMCKYLKVDEENIQEYFFHEEAMEFFTRAEKLISK